jgi:hypothetical protein
MVFNATFNNISVIGDILHWWTCRLVYYTGKGAIMAVIAWIYNYLSHLFLSPLTLWVRIPLMVRCTLLKVQRRIIPVYDGMVFNATFNNISVIGGGNRSTRMNHRPATTHWQTLSHNVVLDALDGYKSMRSRPWRLLFLNVIFFQINSYPILNNFPVAVKSRCSGSYIALSFLVTL